MTVMGVDPGLERLGYAMIRVDGNTIQALSYGLISTQKTEAHPKRLKQIYADLQEIIQDRRPDYLSVETLIFAKNVKTASSISEVRGVILLSGALFDIPIVEYTPLQVKMAVTGYGKSAKPQIERAVQMILGLSEIPKPDDVCDALAIAICGANHIRYTQRIDASIPKS